MFLDSIFLASFQFKEITILANKETGRAAEKQMQTLADLTPEEKTKMRCDIKEVMEWTNLTKQERESKLADEFDRFTPEKGETIQSYYIIFAKLINDINIIRLNMTKLQVNTKFVTIFSQNGNEADARVRAMRARFPDPLALIANTYNPPPSYGYVSNTERGKARGTTGIVKTVGDYNANLPKKSSSGYDADAERAWVDKVIYDADNVTIEPSYDNKTLTEVHHLKNDTFENVFAHGIQNHEQPESIFDTYVVNENNSNIIYDIPNMDPNRGKKEHDDVDNEQERALFASLVNNLKCEVENYTKIKLLNEEISNLKSQACKKEKPFHKENEKYVEYVQPLFKTKNELEKTNQEFLKQINDLDNKLRKTGQTAHTLHMLLPKKIVFIRENKALSLRTKMMLKTLLSWTKPRR
ncbi:hypothetical protein Tco_0088086 [Tanacetum coccineum]